MQAQTPAAILPFTPAAATRAGAAGIRAVLFDVDGTLYSQPRLRALVARDLVAAALRAPVATVSAARILRTFRHTREELRSHDGPESLEALQYSVAAKRLGTSAERVQMVVDEWMLRRPLPLVASTIQPELRTALQTLRARQIRIGALSDYPVAEKLRALAVDTYFSVSLCTTDASINAFKPNPKGFLRACELWGLTPQEVLYVGDRPEIDAAGASAAGLHCAIIAGRGHVERDGLAPRVLSRFGDLPGLVNTL